MNIVAYCRVSTEKEDQLNSLDAQKKFFSEYAEKQGHTLVKIYADEGISGTKIKNRKEFLQLLKDAEQGLFEMVVVKDISRFSRNTVDLLTSIRKLKQHNIDTIFLTGDMKVMGESEFVLTIFGALAQEESANTSKRVKFGKQMNAEKGRVPNQVYGYDKTKGDYFNLTINEYESSVIRRMYDLYIREGHGMNKIAQILNAEGIRTKRNAKWTQNGITRILTNELYIGKVINGKEEVTDFLTSKREKKDEQDWFVVERPEFRIIDDESFANAAKILAGRNNAFNINHERQSNKHLFSTLIKCECCGYSFRRTERAYKNVYIKWVCSGRNANGKDSCPNTTKIDELELKQALKDYLTALLKSKDTAIKNIVTEFNRIYKSREENDNLGVELQQQIEKAQKSRQKYLEMYEDELITRDELREKVGVLNKQIEKWDNQLKLVNFNLTKGEQLEQALEETFLNLNSTLNMDNMSNVQLKRLIEKIVVDEHGAINVYLKLLSDIGLDQNVLLSDYRTQRHHRPCHTS